MAKFEKIGLSQKGAQLWAIGVLKELPSIQGEGEKIEFLVGELFRAIATYVDLFDFEGDDGHDDIPDKDEV